MSNNINQDGRTWGDILEFETFTVNDAYIQTGIRDVLTTLTRNGATEDAEDRGMASLSGNEQRESVGLTGLNDVRGERESLRELDEAIERINGQDQEQQGQGNTNEEESQMSEEPERRVSLNELFGRRQTDVTSLDSENQVTLRDMQETDLATTYTRPNLSRFTRDSDPIVEFGEDVVLANTVGYSNTTLEIKKEDYDAFNRTNIQKRNDELSRQQRSNEGRYIEREEKIKTITQELFGDEMESMYGYDKIGRFADGRPYIKAVLATRFNKLYDRRFRKREEMHQFSKNVAIANTLPSVKGLIEITIKGEENGDLVAEVVNAEGVRIPYLEDKLAWLKGKGLSASLWVLYLKTQYEFEDTIETMSDLLNKEFTGQ